MSARKRKSFIWNHFETSGDKKATCSHCNKIFAYSGATMSNLNRHLKRVHPEIQTEENPLEIFTVHEVAEVEAAEGAPVKSFEITMKNFDEFDAIMKEQEKDDKDPDWSPNHEGKLKTGASLDSVAGPSDPKKERKCTRRSVVWDHFQKSSCKQSGQCLHCGKIIKLGTISNLSRHLRQKHPVVPLLSLNQKNSLRPETVAANFDAKDFFLNEENEYSEVVEVNVDNMENPINIIETKTSEHMKNVSDHSGLDFAEELDELIATQASQTEFLNDSEDFDINDYIRPKKVAVVAEQVDRQLVRMIVKGCYPVSLVEQPDFKDFVSLLNPKYVLPSTSKVALELIPGFYRECERRATKSLQAAEGIVLYIDQWKSKSNNYMCVTAHIINGDCKFESLFLSCHILSTKEGSSDISDRINETTKDWEITEKVIAIMTDNTSSIASAAAICEWPHIPHLMRALSLVLDEALSMIKTVVIKVRNITEALTKFPELLANVYSTGKLLKLPQVKLIKKVNNDWSSSFMIIEMLTRFEKLRFAITQVLKNHPEIEPLMTEVEWRNLKSFVEVTSIFKSIKREIVQEKRVFLSKVFFYVRTLKTHLKKIQTSSTSASDATFYATQIVTNFDNFFVDLEKIEMVSNVLLLDPRLKKYVFQDESEYAAACSRLKKEVCEVVMSEPKYPEPNPDSFWHYFDDQIRKLNAVKDPIGKGILELENYLQEPIQNRNEDPLVWWSQRRAIYPRLFKLAKKYLCVSCTSNLRESISYKSAYMLSHLKYNESSPTESEVMFLHHNM